MDSNEYLLSVGKLVANLQSLEFMLRGVLAKHNEETEPAVDLSHVAAGQKVPVNSMTSYESLGELIMKFNDIVKTVSPSNETDERVVRVRDMMAHGRVAGATPRGPLQLIKFGRPRNGLVPVEDVLTLDAKCLSSMIGLVWDQMKKVREASNVMGQGIIELM